MNGECIIGQWMMENGKWMNGQLRMIYGWMMDGWWFKDGFMVDE
jgi:hypothetical protein